VIISDFCGFLDFFLDLDQEIMDFYKYLDRDFSSIPICLHFVLQNWLQNGQKVWEIQIFFKKSRQKSRLSRKSMVISIYLDSLD
jgi:hypothetical protein